MNKTLTTFSLLLAFTTCLIAQEAAESKPSLLRAERNQSRGVVKIGEYSKPPFPGAAAAVSTMALYENKECILVFVDGSLHMERSLVTNEPYTYGTTEQTKVLTGILSGKELAALKALRANSDFSKIVADRTGDDANRPVTSDHAKISMQAWIPRADGEQHFFFPDEESRKEFAKPLKPFDRWWRELDKKKFSEDNASAPTGCKQ